jgi:hypothetical protein
MCSWRERGWNRVDLRALITERIMETMIFIVATVALGFVATMWVGKSRDRRALNWVRLIVLVAASVWMLIVMASGIRSGIFVVLLAIIFASAAVAVGWNLWSSRERSSQD